VSSQEQDTLSKVSCKGFVLILDFHEKDM